MASPWIWRDAWRQYGSPSDSTRCPAADYNPFSDVRGCAKLPWFRRGLRFTVSLRTGVVFLGDRTSLRRCSAMFPPAFSETALRRKNSSIDDLGQAAVT
jgi:hypothetical protein